MASGNTVSLVFAGDSKSLEKTFDNVGKASKDMANDFDKAGADAKTFGSKIDGVNDTIDHSERKFMGAADLLDGIGGAFGVNTQAVTGFARSFGDMAGGFTELLAPMLQKLGLMTSATVAQAGATTEATAAQSGLNVAMLANPIGAVVLAVGAAVAVFVLLWNKVDAFREGIKDAWHMVENFVPGMKLLGDAVGWVTGLFHHHKDEVVDTSEAYGIMRDNLNASLDAQQQKWQQWHDNVTTQLQGIESPLQRAREQSKVSFDDINKNLTDNIAFYTGWINNLNTLTDRGFGALATKMFELGPTAEKAVGEMTKKSDTELQKMTDLFAKGGASAAAGFSGSFLNSQSLTAMGDAGATAATSFKNGFDKGLGPINIPINRLSPAVPHLAEGGVVTSPTLALIGEAGPEAVVPLGAGGMGGNVTVNVYGTVVTENQLIDAVHNGLLRKQRRTPLGLN